MLFFFQCVGRPLQFRTMIFHVKRRLLQKMLGHGRRSSEKGLKGLGAGRDHGEWVPGLVCSGVCVWKCVFATGYTPIEGNQEIQTEAD